MKSKKHYLLLSIAFIMIVVMIVQTYSKAYRENGYDFTSFMLSAEALVLGEDPYSTDTPFTYIYPLFLAFILIPFTMIPYWLSNTLWITLNLVSVGVIAKILNGLSQPFNRIAAGSDLVFPSVVVFLLLFSPIQSNFLNGQVNIVVLLFSVLFFRNYLRGKSLIAGTWLGAAIALKLLPAIFIVFLLLRRQVRVAIYSVSMALLFCLLPWVITGNRLFEYYRYYAEAFLFGHLFGSQAPHPSGVILNLYSVAGFIYPRLAGGGMIVKLSCTLITLGVIVLIDTNLRSKNRSNNGLGSFSVYLVGAVFMSPISETHHMILLFPAIYILARKYIVEPNWISRQRVVLAISYIVSFNVLGHLMPRTPITFLSIILLLIMLMQSAKPRIRTTPILEKK